jgi:thiamine biosynthesis protein ThiS
MKLIVNGEARELDRPDLTVVGLLEALGLAERRVAVEVNQRIVRRADQVSHRLAEADVVEIVQFVGGG